MQSITIGKNQAGQRFDKFLHKYLPNAGSSFLYKMLRKKNITLNGKKAEGKEILTEGDVVQCFFSEETFAKFSGKEMQSNHIIGNQTVSSSKTKEYLASYQKLQNISVLYEDDDIIALNKPVGILTQKASDSDLSLNEWLIGYLLESKNLSEKDLATFKPSVCNRLDRNTSGLVLCGKSLKGSQYLSRIIKEHSLRKFYYTICEGILAEEMLLEGYLKKNTKTNTVTILPAKDGKDPLLNSGQKDADYIKTAFIPLAFGEGYTLLCVELFTGKTHQIRAHLNSIGHPIIGDPKYGSLKHADNKKFSLKNQLLHAHHVIFPEDTDFSQLSGQKITAPCPEQFIKIAQKLNLEDML